jgi:hypothetical protein
MGTVIGFAPPAATTAPALNERFLFAFQVLVGYTVEVQVRMADPMLLRPCAVYWHDLSDRSTCGQASLHCR